jgi:hypothetical protein
MDIGNSKNDALIKDTIRDINHANNIYFSSSKLLTIAGRVLRFS